MPEARMRGEQWYPVKCDCVAKDAVIDLEKDDSKTLHLGLLSEFKEQNSTDTIDCTAMKATWLSNVSMPFQMALYFAMVDFLPGNWKGDLRYTTDLQSVLGAYTGRSGRYAVQCLRTCRRSGL